MFTHRFAHTYSDKIMNEDVFSIGKHHLFVIDGATGLGKNDLMGLGDDARWFAQEMKRHLEASLHLNEDLESIVLRSIKKICDEYDLNPDQINKIDMPSACIALFRERNDFLEFYGLGDTCGVIELMDHSVEMVTDSVLEALDDKVIRTMQKISKEKKIPLLQTRPDVNAMLIEHRKLRNTPNGYYALDLSETGARHAVKKCWPLSDVCRVACMSDGFSQIMDFDYCNSMSQLLDAVDQDPLKVFKDLYDLQEQDALCSKVPRLKKRDDTTLAYAKVNKYI